MASSRRILWWLVTAGVLAGGVVVAMNIEQGVAWLRRPPPLVVSPATTSIVAPVGADGLPDFFRAAFDKGPPAVPATSNAAAALWEVLPDEPPNANLIDHSFARLTAADQRPAGERFDPRPIPPEGIDADAARIITADCVRGPWKANDQPWLASWLDRNAAALDIVAAGARREGWCPPWCLPADLSPEDRSGEMPPLLSVSLPGERLLAGELGTALLVRAMRRLGEGDPTGAWHDLDVLLRYADKATDIAEFPGGRLAMDSLILRTARVVQRLVCDGRLDDAHLADLQRSLRSVADCEPVAADIGFYRLVILDTIAHTFVNPSRPLPWQWIVPVDRGALLAAANRETDRTIAAVSLPTRAERMRAWSVIAADWAERRAEPIPPRAWFQPGHEVLTESFQRTLFGLILPDAKPLLDGADRSRAELLLADTAAAIERYRLRVGRPPEALDDLVPEWLPALPIDPFTDRSFEYRTDGDGWELQSADRQLSPEVPPPPSSSTGLESKDQPTVRRRDERIPGLSVEDWLHG